MWWRKMNIYRSTIGWLLTYVFTNYHLTIDWVLTDDWVIHQPSIDCLLTDYLYLLTIDWVSIHYWPSIDQCLVNYRRSIGKVLASCRCTKSYVGCNTSWPIYWPTIDWVSTDSQPIAKQLSTACQLTIDWLSSDISTDCRPIYRLRVHTLNMIQKD